MLGTLSSMKSFNVCHVQQHLAAILAEVERGEVIEVHRRGRPVARFVPAPSEPPPPHWSHVGRRLREAYPAASSGVAAAATIADGRGER